MLQQQEMPRAEERPATSKYRFDVRAGVDPRIAIQKILIERSGLDPMSWVRLNAGKFRDLIEKRADFQMLINSGEVSEGEMREIESRLSA